MTHRTMRDFLGVLEKKGLLRRIARPVDRMWKPAALAKWMYQALPPEKRFGMFFEKVNGSDIPLVTAALGANTAAYATALGVGADDISDAWVRACRNPIPPKVDAGTFSLPPREIMMKALDLWKEIGLPEFEIPKRAKLRIDRS